MGLRTWLGLKKAAPQPPVAPAFAKDFGAYKSRAQLFQDLWVLSETGSKRGGFFVEIGAFDGIDLSNSYLLEKDFGWRGILVEPNPKFSETIRSIRSSPLCTSPIHSISGRQVTMQFVPNAPELSYMSDDTFDDPNAGIRMKGKKIEQTTISLNDLLAKYDAPQRIDFMSIDTEGNEVQILSTFDANRYHISLMCIEHNETKANQELDRMMIPRGYERVYRDWSRWDAWYRKQ